MKVAICPGTFDPVTNGHIDIIKRAAAIFEKIIVAVAENTSKKTLFSCRERVLMVRKATQDIAGVTVEEFSGLVVDFARKKGAKTIIRGLRMISDFEYEFQMALTNRNLAPDIETIFFMPHPNYSYISSRLIKEVISLGADLRQFLPAEVMETLKIKLNEDSDR